MASHAFPYGGWKRHRGGLQRRGETGARFCASTRGPRAKRARRDRSVCCRIRSEAAEEATLLSPAALASTLARHRETLVGRGKDKHTPGPQSAFCAGRSARGRGVRRRCRIRGGDRRRVETSTRTLADLTPRSTGSWSRWQPGRPKPRRRRLQDPRPDHPAAAASSSRRKVVRRTGDPLHRVSGHAELAAGDPGS